jgi:hypothetical protein
VALVIWGCSSTQPPEAPQGFFGPPRALYSGVLLVEGLPGTTRRIQIDYLDDQHAVVQIAPDCTLRATIVQSPYVDVPGQGFERRTDGVLSFEDGSSCVVGGGQTLTIHGGTANLSTSGLGEIVAIASGRAVHFSGTLVEEREAPVAATSGVQVHVLAKRSFRLTKGETQFAPRLERDLRTPDGDTWQPICVAPCVATVDPKDSFRIGGSGALYSNPFTLPQGRRRVVLQAAGTSTGARIFGWGFTVGGALPMGAGLGLLVSAAISHNQPDDRFPESPTSRVVVGGLLALEGLPFLIIGLVRLAESGTTVTTDQGEDVAAAVLGSASSSMRPIPGGFTF